MDGFRGGVSHTRMGGVATTNAGAAPRGRRTPQQARSRRTRERILQAAIAGFEDEGYDATTTAAIARRAGIAVGTLYGYFPDKRSILLEILHDTVEEVADHVVRGLAPEAWRDADPRESVRSLVEAAFESRNLRPGVQRILWERYFKDPGFHDAMEAIAQRVQTAIERLLEALKAEGRLRIDDVSTAAFVVYSSVEWTGARLLLGDAPSDTRTATDAATDMILRFLFR